MDLSFVFPCLNEEATLGMCIEELKSSLDQGDYDYEIVIADNGSTDRSAEIATEMGARVVPVKERGYGAALRGGIEAAKAPYVMFADADFTYPLKDAHDLFMKARENDADMAIASRMTGDIEDGAMPPLHRHLGTPVLTGLINLLFSGKLTDCNAGFRCIKKEAYATWDIRASGMEFASELLIKALKNNAKTVEIPSGLRKDQPGREPHLRTWRDGMRHLLFILSEKPQLFERTGFWALIFFSLIQLTALVTGPVAIGDIHIFDTHTRALALLGAMAASPVYLLGLTLLLSGKEKMMGTSKKLLNMDEGVLFFTLVILFGAIAAMIAAVVVQWAVSGFSGLHIETNLLSGCHLLGIPLSLGIGILGIHTVKKGLK